MKRFLAVYTGSHDGMSRWEQIPETERKKREQAGMGAWTKWADEHKGAIVESGGPLGRTKRVSTAGLSDIRNSMAAFTIVQAESHEAAAKIFLNHPHFTIFPGDGVEIMEVLAIPSR